MNTYRITVRQVNDTEAYATVSGVTFGPGNHKLLVVSLNTKYVVLKSKGHSDNHGSRHSGLRSYYPGGTHVYAIDEISRDDYGQIKIVATGSAGWVNERGVKSQISSTIADVE